MAKNYQLDKGYTFDDVCLVPQFNNVPSRTKPSLQSWLKKNQKIDIPLFYSNMEMTISDDLAEILVKAGSIPIYHRFTADIEDQKKWVRKWRNKTFVSCGTREDQLKLVGELFDLGVAGICIDVACGYSEQMLHFIDILKSSFPTKEVIAGNACTPMAYHDLVNAGMLLKWEWDQELYVQLVSSTG